MSIEIGSSVWIFTSNLKVRFSIPEHITLNIGPNGKLAYVPGFLKSIESGGSMGSYSLEWEPATIIKVSTSDVFERNIDDNSITNNFDLLKSVNDASILNIMYNNFNNGQFTTMLGSTLVLSNPMRKFVMHNAATIDIMNKYYLNQEKLPSNILQLAMKAYTNVIDDLTSHSLMFVGCSGSGKTEATKQVLQFLMYANSSMKCSHMEEPNKRLSYEPLGTMSNPLLQYDDSGISGKAMATLIHLVDLMGNAPSGLHQNSSRHLKVIKMCYNDTGQFIGLDYNIALLDMSCLHGFRDKDKMPFNIFRILCAGLSSQSAEFKISSHQRDSVNIGIDIPSEVQEAEYNFLEKSILESGISEENWRVCLRLLVAVMHLETISIVGADTAIISSGTKSLVNQVDNLLGCEVFATNTLINKRSEERMGRTSLTDNKPSEARNSVDGLACELYIKVFTYLTSELMKKINTAEYYNSNNHLSLNIVDAPGWEVKDAGKNGISQFYINYIDEKFHTHFVNLLFTKEIQKYADENIQLAEVNCAHNDSYLELFDKPPTSLITLLEEACTFKGGTDSSFLEKSLSVHAKGQLFKSGGHKLKKSVFIITHSFGDVGYDSDKFIEINKSQLTPDVEKFIKALSIPIFPSVEEIVVDSSVDAVKKPGKLGGATVLKSSLFLTKTRENLSNLLDSIEKSIVYYSICFRHNEDLSENKFNPDFTLSQIKHTYLTSLTKLNKSCYRSNQNFIDFYYRFRSTVKFSHPQLPMNISDKSSAEVISFCKILLKECISTACLSTISAENEPVFGLTRIFMTEWTYNALEEMRKIILKRILMATVLIQSIYRMRKYKRKWNELRKGLIMIQSNLRMKSKLNQFKKLKKSAIKIQSFVKTVKANKYFLKLKKMVNIIKSRILGAMIVRIRFKKYQRQLRVFAGLSKGLIVRQRIRHIYKCVLVLQTAAKKFVNLCRLQKLQLISSIKLQKLYRGYYIRHINVTTASILYALDMRKKQRIVSIVVRKLQSIWRQHSISKRFRSIINATRKIQVWAVTRNTRNRFLAIKMIAKWLQKMCKKIIAVNKMDALRGAVMLKQELVKLDKIRRNEINKLLNLSFFDLRFGIGLLKKNGTGMLRNCKFDRLLVNIDFLCDISEYYPDGWTKSIIDFCNVLKNENKTKLSSITLGSQHTIIVDDNSNVFSMGNGDLGQLGHSNKKEKMCPQPKLIEGFNQILAPDIKKVAIGNSIPSRFKVLDVCCGKDHTIVLTSANKLFSWGCNKHGQLGHSNFENSSAPREVPLKNVKQVSCGNFHSACIVDPGKLYVWGSNDCLGRGKTEIAADSCEPYNSPFFMKKRVHDVCCGDNHITVRSNVDLYSWGINAQGQLGCGDDTDKIIPTKVLLPIFKEWDMNTSTIQSGGRHMHFHIKGDLWTWGWNKHGQIGNGTTINVTTPIQMKILQPNPNSKSVTDLVNVSFKMSVPSWKCSFILGTNGVIYACGQTSLIQDITLRRNPYTVRLSLKLEDLNKKSSQELSSEFPVLIPAIVHYPDQVKSIISLYGNRSSNGLSFLTLETESNDDIILSNTTNVSNPLFSLTKKTPPNSPIKIDSGIHSTIKSTISPINNSSSIKNGSFSPLKTSNVPAFSHSKAIPLNIDRDLKLLKSDALIQVGSVLKFIPGSNNKTKNNNEKIKDTKEIIVKEEIPKKTTKILYDRNKEGEVTNTGLLGLFSPQVINKQMIHMHNFNELAEIKSCASRGVGMPKSDKSLLTKFAKLEIDKSKRRTSVSINSNTNLKSVEAEVISDDDHDMVPSEMSRAANSKATNLSKRLHKNDSKSGENHLDLSIANLKKDVESRIQQITSAEMMERIKSPNKKLTRSFNNPLTSTSVSKLKIKKVSSNENNDELPVRSARDLAAMIQAIKKDKIDQFSSNWSF